MFECLLSNESLSFISFGAFSRSSPLRRSILCSNFVHLKWHAFISLRRNHFNIFLLLFELFFLSFAFHHRYGLRIASLSLLLASHSVNWDGIVIVRCLSYKRMKKSHHQLIELTWILISPWYALFYMLWDRILRSNRITIIDREKVGAKKAH